MRCDSVATSGLLSTGKDADCVDLFCLDTPGDVSSGGSGSMVACGGDGSRRMCCDLSMSPGSPLTNQGIDTVDQIPAVYDGSASPSDGAWCGLGMIGGMVIMSYSLEGGSPGPLRMYDDGVCPGPYCGRVGALPVEDKGTIPDPLPAVGGCGGPCPLITDDNRGGA